MQHLRLPRTGTQARCPARALHRRGPRAKIEKTAQTRFDLGERGEKAAQTIEYLHELAELGIQVARGLADVGSLRPLELMAGHVIPAVDKF